jgi:hypothetical protein
VALLHQTVLAQDSARSASGTRSAPAKVDRRVQPGANVSVVLSDGSTMYGRLERRDADSLVMVGAAGRVAVAITNVRTVRDAGEARRRGDGSTEYWFPNANSTRLFFAPTGRTLAQGDGYFADHDIAIASLTYGFTDRVTFGGGGLIVPSSDFWFVTPKVGLVRGSDFNLAVGALFGGVGDHTGGIGFVSATYGSTNRSATLAVGNAFSGSEADRQQIVMLGGETRVSRRMALVTENYSVDLAFLNWTGHGVFPGIPYVDFVVKF